MAALVKCSSECNELQENLPANLLICFSFGIIQRNVRLLLKEPSGIESILHNFASKDVRNGVKVDEE